MPGYPSLLHAIKQMLSALQKDVCSFSIKPGQWHLFAPLTFQASSTPWCSPHPGQCQPWLCQSLAGSTAKLGYGLVRRTSSWGSSKSLWSKNPFP